MAGILGMKEFLAKTDKNFFVPDEINDKPKKITRQPRTSAELTVHCQRKVALRNTFHSLHLLNNAWFSWSATRPDNYDQLPPNFKFGAQNGNVIFSPLGFYFPLTVLGACFPGEKDLHVLLGMCDVDEADHAVPFKQAVDYYENAIRFLYDTLLIKPNMINFGYKPTRYWFQCKILIKHFLTDQTFKKLNEEDMINIASNLKRINTVSVVNEILSQKTFEIEQQICPEEAGLRDIITYGDQVYENPEVAFLNVCSFSPLFYRMRFKPDDCPTRKFYVNDNFSVDVKMISMQGMIGFEQTLTCKIIGLCLEINYYILYIILPDPHYTLQDVYSSEFSSTEKCDKFLNYLCLGCPEKDITLICPEIDIEMKHNMYDLSKQLASMQKIKPLLPDMFNQFVRLKLACGDSNESQLTAPRARRQPAFYDMRAAKTMQKHFRFRTQLVLVDRPFFVLLVDKHSRALVLLGRIVNPAADRQE